MAENLIKNAEQAEIEELNLQIAQGKKASKTVCQYVDCCYLLIIQIVQKIELG